MKKVSLLVIAVLCTIMVMSQKKIPLIGEKAPSFTANTTNGILNFPEDFGKNWKILFSHPRDFTPVCTSEVLQLARMQDEFDELGVKVAVISVDDNSTHKLWKKSIEDINQEGIDPVKIEFPILDDRKHVVSKKYGMLQDRSGNSKAVRGVFIINPDNIVQAIIYYPMQVGRNFYEIKRAVVALQTVNNHTLTPANWNPGDDVLLRASPYLDPNLKDSVEIRKQYYNIGPIMWYKRVTN
ncbi:MAG: redoxin domain-containing protein [Mariniphaga sp.]|nr:redoxin domain-containing protein [Mariniphaga sp.]